VSSDPPTAPVVMVLEDSNDRLRWLGRVLGRLDVAVYATDSVETFVEQANRAASIDYPVALVILDYHVSDGTGEYVARQIDRALSDVPVLVWSNDEEGAAQIGAVLERRGWQELTVAPFGSLTAREAILSAVRR